MAFVQPALKVIMGTSKKRPYAPEVIDLTQSSPIPDARPTKARRIQDAPAYLPTPTQSSQASHVEILEDDFDEVVDLTQNEGEDVSSLILYGTIDVKVVGCRFYSGYVTTGEMVVVTREPSNQYDRNAIQVDNVNGEKIGHIPRATAAKLASFMDNRLLRVEACTTGPKDYYECPIRVLLYGSADAVQRSVIKNRMQAVNLPMKELLRLEKDEKRQYSNAEKIRMKELQRLQKAGKIPPGQVNDDGTGLWASTPTESSSQSLDTIIQQAERFTPRQDFDQMVEQFGVKPDDLAKLPMADQPPLLRTQLLHYQRQGLQWLLDKENPVFPPEGSTDIVQLFKWSEKPGFNMNVATRHSQKKLPQLASGGILADDMGLGKTIQVISLILADRAVNQPKPNARSTLILAPLGVMSNWSQQIAQHVHEAHALSVLVYHGTKKVELTPKTISNYDVVITTYDTAAQEYWGSSKKGIKASADSVPRAKGLFSINWRRIALDEGHTIRNPATKKSQAAYALMARSRWVLSGTPIVNTLKDLFSMVKFIRLRGGIENWDLFNQTVVRPVLAGDPHGQYLLQTLMQSICLRRKKDMAFINLKLPELTEYVQRIPLADHEREQYEALEAEAKGELERFRGGAGIKAYNHLFEILLRLRQICNHWKLCGEGRITLPDKPGEALDLTPENRSALLDLLRLKIESQDDCPICLEALSNRDPVITACTHAYCFACVERVIETQHKCPLCRAKLDTMSQVLRLPQESESKQPEFDIKVSSTKVEALLQILRASQKKENTKTVVFSQWTSFLDIVQTQLEEETSIKFCRIDGSMVSSKRDAAMKMLEEDDECTVLLASLGVCSVGLNLVAANQVILSDTWW